MTALIRSVPEFTETTIQRLTRQKREGSEDARGEVAQYLQELQALLEKGGQLRELSEFLPPGVIAELDRFGGQCETAVRTLDGILGRY